MKKIVLSVQNSLLSEAISMSLKKSGRFLPMILERGKERDISSTCISINADILLMEVTHLVGATFESRMSVCEEMKKTLPKCKLVLLCDEKLDSDLARLVAHAKEYGRIDAFFYSSVTASYLNDALASL